MIEKILIKNFQSHKRTILKLHPGINGIIGRPNSGKTAIIRSILLLKDNRPSGFAYHNNLTKDPETEVRIKPDNSPLLKFIKTKSKATYFYGKESFKKFGRDIPDKITNNLNLKDINFGLQLGLPFLVLSTPSEIARQINKVSESEVINKCIKMTNDRINKLKSKRNVLKSGIDEIEDKLIQYKNLDKVKPIIDKALKYELKKEGIVIKIEELSRTYEFVVKAKRAIKNQEKPLKAKGLIEKAQSLQYNMENISSQLTLLQNIKMLKQSLKAAVEEKQILIDNYISQLKESKRCPVCYSPIQNKMIKEIRKELDK